MNSWIAAIAIEDRPERRAHFRWRLQMIAPAPVSDTSDCVVVLDLSEAGMMVQTSAELRVGDAVAVDLPGSAATEARIVWRRETLFGCEFDTPISPAVIGRALLQAPISHARTAPAAAPIEEFPVAIGPSVEEIAAWKAEFELTRGAAGYRLIAFRQTSDGLLIALAARDGHPG